jgi:acyl carrier protein
MEQEFVAAQTPLEHSLAAIWAALLDLDEVGMRDNFFELGGNSILSLRMGLEIRRNLELDVPVVTLFQYPTVGSLAAHLHNPQAQSDSLNAAAKQRAARQKQAFSRGKRPPRVNT